MKKMSNKDILSDPITYVTERGILTVNMDTLVVSIHDGHTPGGFPIGGFGSLNLGQLGNVSPSADTLNNTTDVGKIIMWNGSSWDPVDITVAPSTIMVTTLAQKNALTPAFGTQVYVSNSDDGSGNNVGQWSLWLYLSSGWLMISNQESVISESSTHEVFITPTSGSVIIGNIQTGGRITLISVEVLTPFNGAPTLDIGYTVQNPSLPPPVPAGLMTNSIIDLTTPGTYNTTSDIVFGVDTLTGDVELTASFVANGATVGNAQIIISYV